MQYRRDKKGNELSVLGYGCMRFTKNGSSVDLDKAEKEVMAAIKAGVNYFDTAYVYAGNEAAVGEILDRNHCREQIYLATKLPHYLIKSVAGAEKMFQEELRRLKTDYIDYYLMHMLTDIPTWEKLKKIGMQDWIEEKLASGQIRNIGFSYHGNTEMFKQLVDACDWDFCQIQYNYIDTQVQAGDKGYELAAKMGVPMVIMQGRVHYYEGYPMSDVVLPTRLMGLLGAKKIILTNAAGGVNYNFKPGDFMLITDHITTAVPNPLIGENIDELGTRFPDMSEVYAPELQEKVRKAAEKLQVPLQEGVYMQFTGPSYETPAEIRMCRTWGGDAAGMSTACEAVAANHMGMKVCGISCITNLAAGMSKQKLDHKEVQETADRVSRQFKQLVTEVIKTI